MHTYVYKYNNNNNNLYPDKYRRPYIYSCPAWMSWSVNIARVLVKIYEI